MNAIVKTWRNRLPVIADDLTHWSDIFTWRQHHYQFIVIHYDSQHENATKHDPAMKPSMVGVHASAQVCCTLPFMKFFSIVRGKFRSLYSGWFMGSDGEGGVWFSTAEGIEKGDGLTNGEETVWTIKISGLK